jgi:competence protein ComEA
VHVVGRVRRPGVRTLAAGARVSDALTAAGGALPGAALDHVNLARVVLDGEQVVVPGPGDPVPAAAGPGSSGPPAGADGTGGAGRVVDLNAATDSDLDGLPGVGPVLAGRIVAWRTQHGRFSRVDELGEVAGIGPKLLERLRPLVSV